MTIMNRVAILIVFSISFTQNTSAQSDNNYSKVLPGVVKVSDGLYYDQTEITNINWLEFLYWQFKTYGGRESAAYKATLPDTALWLEDGLNAEPYMKFYHRHSSYREYPVVNVTWQQASDFCSWRTARVKEFLEVNKKADAAPYYFAYRLPTYEEFRMMYDDIAELPDFIGEEGKRKDRGKVRYNQKREPTQYAEVADESSATADVTAPAKSYWPNSYDVYNIKGNVAEWLMEENTYAGGSWRTPLADDESVLLKSESASPSIGFRCVCEVAEEAP